MAVVQRDREPEEGAGGGRRAADVRRGSDDRAARETLPGPEADAITMLLTSREHVPRSLRGLPSHALAPLTASVIAGAGFWETCWQTTRIGLPMEYFFDQPRLDAEVKAAVLRHG